MKKIILTLLLAFAFTANAEAQDDKTVTLIVSGSGKTQEEAKQNALRSAIEQAFGTFISSKTEILNDSLVKDEIVSVANGNIQKFEIVSEVKIPDGGYATSLKATVSVTKLTSFVESKGVVVEFKGSLFGANLKQQKLNEDSELKAVINLCEISNQILGNALDFSIKLSDPIKIKDIEDQYEIPLEIIATTNENYKTFVAYFTKNIEGICMKNEEKLNYQNLGKDVFCLFIDTLEKQFYFRNKLTALAFQNFFMKTNKFLCDFNIVSEIDNNNSNVYFADNYWFEDNDGWNNEEKTFPTFDFIDHAFIKFNSGKYYRVFLQLNCNNNYFLENNNYYGKTRVDYFAQSKDFYPFMPTVFSNIGPTQTYHLNNTGLFYCIGIFYTEGFKDYTFKHQLKYSEEQISKLTKVEIKKSNN